MPRPTKSDYRPPKSPPLPTPDPLPPRQTGRELGGRDGLDPVRYGDWEKSGIAVDF
ncbi:MAG: DUF1674 domain-containing protein [Sandarakinorhabdus sp.]|nr:DUF1674 domain-containing protein [Sandarakinorhabdus sp.]